MSINYWLGRADCSFFSKPKKTTARLFHVGADGLSRWNVPPLLAALCTSQGRGSPYGPNGGFWPDDFSKKNLLWLLYLDLINVPWWRRSVAPERLMTDVAQCMLWSTGSVIGVYEHRHTKRLIHFRYRSFQRRAAPMLSDINLKRCESQGRKYRPFPKRWDSKWSTKCKSKFSIVGRF